MRILFLSKRFPQNRDLIERPYGRFHYLPAGLAALGHEVSVHLFSYRRAKAARTEFSGVRWSSQDFLNRDAAAIWKNLVAEARAVQPDWIIGCSDTWPGWMAHRLARRTGAQLAVDAYDNFEAFMRWNLPLHRSWRRAIGAADLVTAAGPQLAGLLQRHSKAGHPVKVLPMAADPKFLPMSRNDCRRTLSLPDNVPLIGYTGSWGRFHPTDVLLAGFERVRAARPDTRLVLTGSPPRRVLELPGVIATGYLDDDRLPLLVNALDVACIVTGDTIFGRFSYPAKLCEAMACGVPVVATATAPVQWMLEGEPGFVAAVGDDERIAELILQNLALGRVTYRRVTSWDAVSKQLERFLQDAARAVAVHALPA